MDLSDLERYFSGLNSALTKRIANSKSAVCLKIDPASIPFSSTLFLTCQELADSFYALRKLLIMVLPDGVIMDSG